MASVVINTRFNNRKGEADLKELQAKAKETARESNAVEKGLGSATTKRNKLRDEVVRIKEDGVAVMVNKCTWLLLEKIITRYNSRLMSLSKTKATRRSPCYGEERLFLAFLGCWLGRLFRRSLLLVGTLVELGCNHDDSGVLHAILVCPLLWLEETLDGEQRALGELVE